MAQTARKLFSVRYGERPHEILFRPWGFHVPAEGEASIGPYRFQVDPEGKVFYIIIRTLDGVRINIYDFKGKFIKDMDIKHSVKQNGYEIDKKGVIIIKGSGEYDLKALFLDPQGRCYLHYIDYVGDCRYKHKLICLERSGNENATISKSLNEALLLACKQGFDGQLIGVTAQGRVCFWGYLNNDRYLLCISSSGNSEYIKANVSPCKIIIDISNERVYQLKQIGEIVSTFGYNINSEKTKISINAVRFDKVKVKVYEIDRRSSYEYELLPKDKPKREQEELVGLAHAAVDGRGHLYLQMRERELKMREIENPQIGDFRVTYPHHVLEYDPRGKRMRTCAKVEYPSYGGILGVETFWDVDRVGNLYYLRWTETALEVWMVPVA